MRPPIDPKLLPRMRRGFPARSSATVPADDFTSRYNWPLSAKKFHALGVLAFYWNSLSYRTQEIHDELYRGDPSYKKGASAKMNGETLTARARIAPILGTLPEPVRDAVHKCADAIDVCRDNRNALLHAAMTTGLGMSVSTGSRSNPVRASVWVPVGEIRRVCDEVLSTCDYANSLLMGLLVCKMWRWPENDPDAGIQPNFEVPRPLRMWSPKGKVYRQAGHRAD